MGSVKSSSRASSPTSAASESSHVDGDAHAAQEAAPLQIRIQLHFRKGQPLVRCRATKDLPDPAPYMHHLDSDSFGTMKDRIKQLIPDKTKFAWLEDTRSLYIQPAHSTPQTGFIELTQDNFEERLLRTWRTESRRLQQDPNNVFVHIHVYVVPRNRVSTSAAASGVYGPARARALAAAVAAPSAARQLSMPIVSGDEEVDELDPQNHHHNHHNHKPLHRSSHHDMDKEARRMRKRERREREQREREQREALGGVLSHEYKTLTVLLNGVEVPVQVKVNDLRHALGLPRFEE
ncbi:hypothetical protein EDD11_007994 [Mortierella claussenii]|nr:hypothetical protein EDD11_007994 [Mortierella claussenii]